MLRGEYVFASAAQEAREPCPPWPPPSPCARVLLLTLFSPCRRASVVNILLLEDAETPEPYPQRPLPSQRPPVLDVDVCSSQRLCGEYLPPITPTKFVPPMSPLPRARHPYRMRPRRTHPSSRRPRVPASAILVEAFRPHISRPRRHSDHRVPRGRRCEPHHHSTARGPAANK